MKLLLHPLSSIVSLGCCLAFLLLPASTRLSAQVTTADIVGAITDSSGGALPGATVTATNLGTGAKFTSVTDGSGAYNLTLLPVGRYRVAVELNGFKTATTDVTLAIGDRLRFDTPLQVGELTESIEVQAVTPALKTDSSSVGSLIDERAMQDLPLNGRNFVALAQLATGANAGVQNALSSGNRPDDRRQSSSVSVNGQDSSLNNFLIDGIDNNERFIGTVVVRPSVDAIRELKVETNAYSAELGRTAGGVINVVTKAGENAFHGSAYEYYRNQGLDARNFFAVSGPKPDFNQNQYGGSLGGPIVSGKTFFFGDYSGYRLDQGLTYTSTVPTLAERQGNFAGVASIFDPLSTRANPLNPAGFVRDRFAGDQIPANRIDPVALALINLYPLPTTNGTVNNFSYSPTKTQRDNSFDGRVDHRFSDKDALYVRYSFNNTVTAVPNNLPEVNGIFPGGNPNTFAGDANQRAQAVQGNYVHTFSSTMQMELKGGYNRYVSHTLPSNYGVNVDTQLGLSGGNIDADSSGLSLFALSGYTGLGDAYFIPLLLEDNTYQAVGSLLMVHGAHSFKIGGEARKRDVLAFQSPYAKGYFQFDGNLTNDPSGASAGSGNSLASFLLGYPASTTRSKYLIQPNLRLNELAGYAQDDWRATHWLTLNLGVRYEYFSPLTEADNQIANVDLSTGQIIVAGQNGISTSAGVLPDRNNIAPRIGFAATVTPRTVVRGGYGISYVPPFIGSTLPLRNPPFVSLYTSVATALTPANQLSNGLPQPVATDPANPVGSLTPVSFDLKIPLIHQFNVTVQRELPLDLVATVGYVGALSRDQLTSYDVNRPLPGPGAIQPRRPYVDQFPNVASITLANNNGSGSYHALQASLERRFSKGFGLRAGYTWAHSIDNYPLVGGGGIASAYPQLIDDLALERGSSDLDIRHRFTLNVNYLLPFAPNATGLRGALARGWQVNAIAILQTGPPFTVVNGAAQANTGAADRPDAVSDPNTGGAQTVQQWFNTTAFVTQPIYTVGDAGRNTVRAPGMKDVDLSLFKDFAPIAKTQLQFRAEAFNVFNHPNFGYPGNQLGTQTFGVISDTGNNLPRNIQLAVKFLF
jgi:outer membrane receptor protein involved in Fe transport